MNKLEPRDFYILYYNLSKIKILFQKISQTSNNLKLYEYISSFINSKIDIICDEVRNFINDKFNVERINNIVMDKLGNYNIEDLDFINKSYDNDLNKYLRETMDSKEVFEAIRLYLSNILKKYEKNKEGEYIKIHETSKSDSFLLGTKRRVIILQECLKKEENEVNITYLSKFSRKEEIYVLDLSKLEYIEHGSNKTNMVITSPAIKKMAQGIQNDKEHLISKINQVYNNILREFIHFNNKSKLSQISQFIGILDTAHNRAYNANKFNYVKPLIENIYDSKSYFNAEKLRHPLIEQLNQNELYVSNNIELGSTYNCSHLWNKCCW